MPNLFASALDTGFTGCVVRPNTRKFSVMSDRLSSERRTSLRGPLIRLSIVFVIVFYIGVLFGKAEALRIFAQAGCQIGF